MPYAPVWLKQIFTAESYFILGLVAVIPNILLDLGTVIWGRLADKYGTKPFVLLGIGAAFLMYSSLLLFVRTASQFLVIILIGNIFVAAELANIYSMATLSVKKDKEVVLGKITIAMSLSWLIASPVAGFIRDAVKDMSVEKKEQISAFFSRFFSPAVSENLDMLFQLLIAIIAVILAFISASYVKTEKPKIVSQPSKTIKMKLSNEPLIFIFLLIFTFTFQAASTGFWSYHSVYFYTILDISGSFYSLFLIITTILGIGLSFLLGRIKKTITQAWVVTCFMFFQFVIFLLMQLFPLNATLVVLLYAFPMYPIFQIPLYSLITDFSNKEYRSTVYGVYNTVGLTGGIIATLLLGLIADKVPLGFFVIILLTLILSAVSLAESFLLSMFLNKYENKKQG